MKKDKEETMEAIQESQQSLERKLEEKETNFTAQLQAINSMLWETKEAHAKQSLVVERIDQNQERMLAAMEALLPPKKDPIKPPISAVEQGSCHGVVR